jgi:hypothetical protein
VCVCMLSGQQGRERCPLGVCVQINSKAGGGRSNQKEEQTKIGDPGGATWAEARKDSAERRALLRAGVAWSLFGGG